MNISQQKLSWLWMTREAGYIRRFHTKRLICSQNIAEHCFGVANLCYALCAPEKPSGELIEAALFHDMAELETGDIPAPVKWTNPDLKNILEDMEAEFNEYWGINWKLSPYEQLTLKWADMLELLLKSIEEYIMGNKEAHLLIDSANNYLSNLPYHEEGKRMLYEIMEDFNASK